MGHRTHLIEMNEIQMRRIVQLLEADMKAHPQDYVDDDITVHNSLTYLAGCFHDTLNVSDQEYDRNMVHGFTI